jgi:hypothetical protein
MGKRIYVVAALQPRRPGQTVVVTWAADRALYARVARMAVQEHRTRSAMVRALVAEAMEARAQQDQQQ